MSDSPEGTPTPALWRGWLRTPGGPWVSPEGVCADDFDACWRLLLAHATGQGHTDRLVLPDGRRPDTYRPTHRRHAR